MGFFSGFIIYMASSLLFSGGKPPSGAFVFTTLFGGWVLSSWMLVQGTRTVSKVFARGFLLGAAEWIAMIPVGMIMSGKALTQTVAQGRGTGAEVAGATIGAGLISFLTGGVSVVMAVVCLIGFVIFHLIGREMRPEMKAPTQTCPECAELIQAAARRCKHCGAEIIKNDAPTRGSVTMSNGTRGRVLGRLR